MVGWLRLIVMAAAVMGALWAWPPKMSELPNLGGHACCTVRLHPREGRAAARDAPLNLFAPLLRAPDWLGDLARKCHLSLWRRARRH
jgi:hypothetical protein